MVVWLLPALILAVVYNQPQTASATGPFAATARSEVAPPLQPSLTPADLTTRYTTPASEVAPAAQPSATPEPAPARNGPIILVAATPTSPRPSPTPVRAASYVAAIELPGGSEPVAVTRTQAVPVGDGVVQWEVPRYDAGQHDATPACGEPGNTIIVGHSVWYEESGVFAPLLDVEAGEIIRCVNSDGQAYNYRVERKWEAPYEDGSWLTQAQPGDLLTLYTCRLDLSGLVIVQAKRIDG